MGFMFMGLDGEMTSSNIDEGGRLCQIGVSVGPDATFTSDIGWKHGDYEWEEQALEVNGFTHERITSGPPPGEIDVALYQWLIEHGADTESRGRTVVVGWAVGSFDMPFVRATLPQSASLISRRYVDLNAITFALDKLYPESPKMITWKRESKRWAELRLVEHGVEPKHHDAGYDAALALLSFEWLRDQIRKGGKTL